MKTGWMTWVVLAGLAGCGSESATDAEASADFVAVTVKHAGFTQEGGVATLVVDASIRNPATTAVTVFPECGGTFGIERWSAGEWIPWGLLASCRSPDLITISPGGELLASRGFPIDPGTFRLVVHEGWHGGDRVAHSGSFEANR